MKQEQVIELAVEAGLIEKDYEHGKTVIAELFRFAALIEQATLEKAALLVEDWNTWESGVMGQSVRALAKETQ
jgi:hypothetical protein